MNKECPLCRDESKGCELVADLAVTRAYLQRSANFQGYCILVLKHHAEELDDLSVEERAMLMEDITRVAHAVRKVCKPRKLNYEILGNVAPHIHCHIIPRYETDPAWDKAAWFALPDKDELPSDGYAKLAAELRRATETSAG